MALTRTTLTTALNATDTVMTVAAVTGFTAGSTTAMLGNELVTVGAVDATALTVQITRGQDSTKPTSHPSGLLVMVGPTPSFTDVGGFKNAVNGDSPNFNALLGVQMRLTTGAATATLTAGQVANGLLLFDGTGGITLTTPTAALLLTAFPGTMVGITQRIILRNTGTGTITMSAGTGVTISGTATIATLNSKEFLIHWTSTTPGAETCTIYSLGTQVF